MRFLGGIHEAAGDIIAAASASPDPELRALVAGEQERHRFGVAMLTRQRAERGLLREGLSAEDATAIVAAHCSALVYADLRREHGWSAEKCEAWLSDAVVRLVLAF